MCLYTYKRTNWCVFCQQFKMGRDNVMYLKFSRSVHNFTWLNPFSQCSIHASKFLNNKAAVALSKCCLSVGWTVENPISAYSFGRGTSLDAMFWSCDLILINCCIIDFSGAFFQEWWLYHKNIKEVIVKKASIKRFKFRKIIYFYCKKIKKIKFLLSIPW